jgi:hypothetical protein
VAGELPHIHHKKRGHLPLIGCKKKTYLIFLIRI